MKNKTWEDRFENYWYGTFGTMSSEDYIKYKDVSKCQTKQGFKVGYELAKKELEEQLKNLEDVFNQLVKDKGSNDRDYLELSGKYNVSEKRLKEAREVIEFYGNGVESWGTLHDEIPNGSWIDLEDVELIEVRVMRGIFHSNRGGKRARAYLEKWK